MTIYERIRALRQSMGMSQEELAHRMGYRDRSMIAKIEGGKVDLSHSKIEHFASVLNTTPAYLMGLTDELILNHDLEVVSLIGEKLKELRILRGYSAEQVAAFLHVSPATIYRYENGDISKMPAKFLKPLSELLLTTPSELMGWTVDPAPDSQPQPEVFSPVDSFQDRLKELIQSCPLSQSDLAVELGVSKQTISAWITGQNTPRAPMLKFLANYFHVSVFWLMGYDVGKNVEEAPEESSLIDSYRSLNDKGKAYIDEQMNIAVQLYSNH